MRFSKLLLSVLFLCCFLAPAQAEGPSKVVVTIDKAHTAFVHRGPDEESLDSADPAAAAVEALVFKSLRRIASGANQLLYNWYELIVAKEADAGFQLTLERVDVQYVKRGEKWVPTSLVFQLKRQTRADGEWLDSGVWRNASGPLDGALEGKHLGALFRKVMMLVPPSRQGGVCPLIIAQAVHAELKAAQRADGVYQ